MEKTIDPKEMNEGDKKILELIQRKKDESEALRKILAAFDKNKEKEKHISITQKQ